MFFGAQERVDKNSLWAVFTPAGLRRVAPRPNFAVGMVCEPLSVQVPVRDLSAKIDDSAE